MHIVIVGGREKNEVELARIAQAAGHTIECHDGGVAGRGIAGIKNAVMRASIVVIVTEINSHGAVLTARKEAQRSHTPTMVVSRLSSARLRGLLQAWGLRAERTTLDGAAAGGEAYARWALGSASA